MTHSYRVFYCFLVCFFVLIQGINYLHNEAPVKVIHRDLKSKNGKDSICSSIGSNCLMISKKVRLKFEGMTHHAKLFCK